MSWCSWWSFPSGFSTIIYTHASSIPFVLHALNISSYWLNHSNYTWRRIQVQKLLIIQFLQTPLTSHLLNTNILLSTLFSNTISLCSSLNVRDEVLHPYRNTGKITVLHILKSTLSGSQSVLICNLGYGGNNSGAFSLFWKVIDLRKQRIWTFSGSASLYASLVLLTWS
jgi:hypothetical protein